ncbi:glycosyltransferase family 4 protein [Arenibaculum pallidiluteum]|uniref:glycosyltransferase family 4 protein n=1 Tax=Arenibaculum pallidiluteum TaxID=2812559 RepID=UPI001A96234E|nr:glycosyltransferase family 4 protein [Arenibaculum pallidiluteum]
MKIVIVNRYFYPDESATSRMTASLAFDLASRGVEVHAVSGRCLHNAPQAGLPPREHVRGVLVHRIRTSRFGRGRLLGRMCDYLTFHLGAAWLLARLLRRDDVCIVCTDPPFLSLSVLLPVLARRARMVNWIMDLFPEVPIALGMMRAGTPLARATLWLRDLSLRFSRWNVAPIRAMADLLRRRGIPAERIAVVHHWSDGDEIPALAPRQSRFRRLWGLEDKFVLGYSGNLGRAHDFSTVIDAAGRLTHRTDIAFLFVGDGHRREWVEREVARRGLRNVMMRPLQPRELLAETLAVADVHLVTLLPAMEPYIVPSKFYGIAAAGRPTLFVGDPTGEIATLVRDGDCGDAFPIGGGEALAARIAALADDPAECARLGANARRLFESAFSRDRGVADWIGILDATMQPAPNASLIPAAKRVDTNVRQ